jgi:hypothetical protein
MMRSFVPRVARRLVARLSNRISLETTDRINSDFGSRLTYLTLAEIRRRYGSAAETLSQAELKVFSQNGEDGVIAEIFSAIGLTNQFFVEFGGWTGEECNTRLLAEVFGWSGVYLERDPVWAEQLAQRYSNNESVRVSCAEVTSKNVNEVFDRAQVPSEFDLLSIDVDGQDYWIWRALEGYCPHVVVIEYNSAIPRGSKLVEREERQPSDGLGFLGASLGALDALANRKGYRLVHAEMAGVNLFFVRSDLADPLLPRPPTGRRPNFYLTGEGHGPADFSALVSVESER